MTTTREEAELMFSKWMETSSKIFFAAFRPDRTVVDSFYGNIVGISDDMVLVMGDGKRAEVDLKEAQFAFVTGRDLPEEVCIQRATQAFVRTHENDGPSADFAGFQQGVMKLS